MGIFYFHRNEQDMTTEKDPFAAYGGRNRVTSMITQILKVTAAIDSGKITQEEGYEILKGAGIGEKELTELINLVDSYR